MRTALACIQEVVPTGGFVVLDTETTGIDYRAEIVQIAIVDPEGRPLVNTLVRPTRPIPWDVINIHGITNEMVADAPPFPLVVPLIRDAIQDQVVIVYNAEYDRRLLDQSARAHGLSVDFRTIPRGWVCAMLAYAQYRNEPGRRCGEPKWHRLEAAARSEGIFNAKAHSALGDCLATLELVKKLAAARA